MSPGTTLGARAAQALRAPAARILLVIAVLSSLGHAVVSLHGDVVPPQLDEMTLLGAGARLAGGEIPYRDVHVHVPPGVLVVHAAVRLAAGDSLLAPRALALMAWVLAWALVAAALARRIPRRAPAAAMGAALAVLGAAWLQAWWPYSYTHWWGLLALIGWAACELGVQAHPRSKAWSAGWCALLVLVPLVDQPAGVLALLVAAWGALLRLRSDRRAELARAAGVALLAAAVAGALAAAGLLGPLLHDTVLWPLTSYRVEGGANDVPTIAQDVSRRLAMAAPGARIATAVAAGALLLAWPAALAFVLGARGAPPGATHGAHGSQHGAPTGTGVALARRVLLVLPLAFLPGRHDLVHVAFLVPLALLGVGLAIVEDSRTARVPAPWARACAALALACGVLATLGPLAEARGPVPPLASWASHDADWSSDGMIVAARHAAEESGGALAVLGRGGRFAFHGVPSPLPRVDLLPRSMGYGADAERDETAAILEREAPRWILLYPRRQAEGFLTEADALGGLLRARYRPAREIGEGLFLLRQGAPGSPP